MSRRLVHLLLSLLLLVAQQLALGHGYAHPSGIGDASAHPAQSPHGGKLPKPVLHHACGHCAAGAHLAFALPSTPRRFVPAALSHAAPAVALVTGACRPAACPFQPRGPPRA